jgi:hypothetical protein
MPAIALLGWITLSRSGCYADPLNFDFSFTNVTGDVNGTVTGLIEGLTNNAISAATHVIVGSHPNGVGGVPSEAAIDYINRDPSSNVFAATNGLISSAYFKFDVLCLSMNSDPNCAGGASFGLPTEGFVQGPVSFTPVSVSVSVSVSVPGPVIGAGLPGLPGLVAACGGVLAWWRRWRKAA